MMRILFVEASSGGVVGGSLTGLYHLIRGLDRARFRAAMVLSEPKAIEKDLRELGVPVHHVRRRRLAGGDAMVGAAAYRRLTRSAPLRRGMHLARQALRLCADELPAAAGLIRLIRRERPDVVHLGNGVRANFDGLLACRATGTPVICHVKGFEKYGARERWASARVDSLTCMTRAVLEHCRAGGLEVGRAQVVYDAVDDAWIRPSRARAAVRAELGIPEGAPCVGIVGNLQPWKGQHVFLDAFARLAAGRPDLHAALVGGVHRAGEGYAAELQRQVRERNLEDRVRFTGFRADVVDVTNALDVVAHASVRPEPFGRVILEAMLLEKPVIAAAAGGVPELLRDGETGWLVPPGDAPSLAAALERVLAAPEAAAAVGRRARAWALENFPLSRQVEQMTRTYESVTGARSSE